MAKNFVHMSVVIPEELAELVRAQAEREDRSKGSVVRTALRNHFAERDTKAA